MRIVAIVICLFVITETHAQRHKPYILAAETQSGISEVKGTLHSALEAVGLQVLGEYSPAEDSRRWVIVITSEELLDAVERIGGLTGFAAALRIGLTREGSKTYITYTDPYYWGNAYFRDDYGRVSGELKAVRDDLSSACSSVGETVNKGYGSEEGITAEDLRSYRYMFGMPRFDGTNELNEFGSYEEAVRTIEKRIENGVPNVNLVYSIEVPGRKLKLYGFELKGEEGESDFLPVIDFVSPLHTAFLPYEFLVMGKEVHMLHGRYRIALSFPDLTMGTFTKIMSTPGNIEDLLQSVVKD